MPDQLEGTSSCMLLIADKNTEVVAGDVSFAMIELNIPPVMTNVKSSPWKIRLTTSRVNAILKKLKKENQKLGRKSKKNSKNAQAVSL